MTGGREGPCEPLSIENRAGKRGSAMMEKNGKGSHVAWTLYSRIGPEAPSMGGLKATASYIACGYASGGGPIVRHGRPSLPLQLVHWEQDAPICVTFVSHWRPVLVIKTLVSRAGLLLLGPMHVKIDLVGGACDIPVRSTGQFPAAPPLGTLYHEQLRLMLLIRRTPTM